MNQQQQNLADFIWNVADVLSGDFRQSEFGRNILRLPYCAGWNACWNPLSL